MKRRQLLLGLFFVCLAFLQGFTVRADIIKSPHSGLESFFWAGTTFTELKDENDNSLTIKFSKDGRSYDVEWWRSGYQALEGKAECGGKVYADGKLAPTVDCMPLGVEQKGMAATGYITGNVEQIELQGRAGINLGVIGPWITGLRQQATKNGSFSGQLTNATSKPLPQTSRVKTPIQSTQKNVEKEKKHYWAGTTFTELKDENDNSLTIKFSKDGRSYDVEWWRSGYQALEGKAECGGKVYADGKLAPTVDCMPLGIEQKAYAVTGYITGNVEKIELQGREGVNLGVIGPWVTGLRQKTTKNGSFSGQLTNATSKPLPQTSRVKTPIQSTQKNIEKEKRYYWAGRTFTALKDENDNSLTIKFSKDGRSYNVEWWRSGYQALEGKGECGGEVYWDGKLEATMDCMPLGMEMKAIQATGYVTGNVEQVELRLSGKTDDIGFIGPWVTGMAQERQKRLKEDLLAKKIKALITQKKQQIDQTSKPGLIASTTQTNQKPTNNIWAGKRFEKLTDEYGNVLSVVFSDDGKSYKVRWAFFGEEHNGLIECSGKIEKSGKLGTTGICTPLNNQRQQGRTDGEILGSVEEIEYTGNFPFAGPWNTGLRELKRQVAEEARLLAKLRTQLGIDRASSQRDGGARPGPKSQGPGTVTNKVVSQRPIEEKKRLNAERKRLAAEQRKLSADRKRAFEAAERARLAAERQKLAAQRQKAEIDKLIAEKERLAAEKLKLAADRKRALEKAEQARLATERKNLAAQRQKAEIDKLIAETERLAAEKLKLAADRKRALKAAEQAKLSAESEKIAAEARRIVAERQLGNEAAERKKLAEEQKRLSMALQELSARQDTFSTPTSQASLRKGKRVALLIGNNNYETLPSLKNAVYDAESMARKLNGLGWITILETNASRRKIARAMDRFRNQAMFADASLVFYAGHGIESQGVNYLVPSDSEVQEEADLRYEAIKTGDFLDLMAGSRSATNILILDSCRNNPLEQGTRGRKRGLSMQHLPDSLGGTVIIYAAAPGSAAEDGPGGGNGIFTGALLDSLSMKDTSLSAVFSNTFSLVAQKTQNRQRPWKSSSLDERRFRF